MYYKNYFIINYIIKSNIYLKKSILIMEHFFVHDLMFRFQTSYITKMTIFFISMQFRHLSKINEMQHKLILPPPPFILTISLLQSIEWLYVFVSSPMLVNLNYAIINNAKSLYQVEHGSNTDLLKLKPLWGKERISKIKPHIIICFLLELVLSNINIHNK